MKTSLEISTLKADWKRDRSWDIEQTPGFEDHASELKAYREHVEADDLEKEARHRRALLDSLKAPGVAALQTTRWPLFDSGLGLSQAGAVLEFVAAMLVPFVERIYLLRTRVGKLEAENESLRDAVHEMRQDWRRP